MRKSAAHEIWRATAVILTCVAILGAETRGTKASEHGRWPAATFYGVVARPGDTVITISNRYRVSASAVARANRLGLSARVTSGRVLLIPASYGGTRSAVLSEAVDHSAPIYARPPRPPFAVRSGIVFQSPVKEAASAPPLLPEHRRESLQTKSALRFSWPIAGPIISTFGPGEHGTRNEGINIAAEEGAPFRAAADGTVSYAGPLRGYGNLILITHAQGYITAYAHAERIAVESGDEVRKGQVIGTAGQSGGVDLCQLHFEIRRGAKPIDPGLLLAADS